MTWIELNEGEISALKGYLFQTSDGQWILSADHNLKSCCIGASHKASSQVFLDDSDFSKRDSLKPLVVRGTLYRQHGQLHLANTEVVSSPGFPLWSLILIASCLIFIGNSLWKKIRQRS